MNTAKGLLTVFFIFSLDPSSLIGQSFEGRIVYRVTSGVPTSESNSIEMPKEKYFRETIQILYFKNNKYREVGIDSKTQKPCYNTLYDPVERRMYYNYGTKCGGDKTAFDFDSMLIEKPIVFQNENDTIHILGKKCKSLTIKHDSLSYSTIYYSNDFISAMDSIAKHIGGFSQYCFLSGSIPLKIIGIDFLGWKWVYTAIEITELKLNARLFKNSRKLRLR